MKPPILDFFPYKQSYGFGSKTTNRVLGVRGFLKGKLSFKETISFLLPGRMSSNRQELWARLLVDYINPDGSVNLFGQPFFVPHKNYGDLVVLIQQIINDDQYHTKRFLRKDSVIIDGGANMGIFCIFVAHLEPSATIYAFEPAPETVETLRKNTQTYPQIKVVPLGLGDETTTRDFQTYNDSSVSNHFISEGFNVPGTEVSSISITTIDEFMKEHPQKSPSVSKVDFIKLDTEGYEANILKGAAETIKQWKPVVAMSAYHRPNDKVELPNLLLSLDAHYKCEMHADNEEDLICFIEQSK